MAHKTETPIITKTSHGDKYSHPAYGVIHMTVLHNNYGMALFGSDIKHRDTVRITISTANLNRSIGHDFIHDDKQIISFEMSHAQFAQFITSQGSGSGTPITIERMPSGGTLESVPGIRQIETKNQTFQNEIRDTANKEIRAQLQKEVDRIKQMVDSGKLSKKELADIHLRLENRMANFSANMAYVVGQAEEALEKSTSDAKIEVESWIDQKFRSIGKNAVDIMIKMDDNTQMLQHNGETENE